MQTYNSAEKMAVVLAVSWRRVAFATITTAVLLPVSGTNRGKKKQNDETKSHGKLIFSGKACGVERRQQVPEQGVASRSQMLGTTKGRPQTAA
jgi:hypothetical protein